MRLADRAIASLPTPEHGQKLYTDDSLAGFAVRVSQGGSRTFVLTYGADRQRITIGRYPIVSLSAAREKARTILAEKQLGIVHKPTPRFSVVQVEYLAQRDTKVRRATRQADDYLFAPFEVLSQKKIGDIEATDVQHILDGLEAPSTRRHAFLRLQGLFSFAVKRGYIDRSPIDRLDCPADQEPRERVLPDAELRQVIETARVYGYPYGTIVELCAIIGQRRQQIGSLRFDHVDFAAKTITWPPELMKTGRRHTIPLGPMTEHILKGMTPSVDGFYFPSRAGGGFVGWSYHKSKFDDECGVKNFRIHDLRRTLATRWQELGIEIATTEKLLSHSAITGGLVGIYQRSTYLTQMNAAVQKWEEYLQALLSKTEDANAGYHSR